MPSIDGESPDLAAYVAADFCGPIAPKRCTRCETLKPHECFNRKPKGLYGRRAVCQDCQHAEAAAWRKANPDKGRAYARAHYARKVARGLTPEEQAAKDETKARNAAIKAAKAADKRRAAERQKRITGQSSPRQPQSPKAPPKFFLSTRIEREAVKTAQVSRGISKLTETPEAIARREAALAQAEALAALLSAPTRPATIPAVTSAPS